MRREGRHSRQYSQRTNGDDAQAGGPLDPSTANRVYRALVLVEIPLSTSRSVQRGPIFPARIAFHTV